MYKCDIHFLYNAFNHDNGYLWNKQVNGYRTCFFRYRINETIIFCLAKNKGEEKQTSETKNRTKNENKTGM